MRQRKNRLGRKWSKSEGNDNVKLNIRHNKKEAVEPPFYYAMNSELVRCIGII